MTTTEKKKSSLIDEMEADITEIAAELENDQNQTNAKSTSVAATAVNTALLDVKRITPILGQGPKERANEILNMLLHTNMVPYLIGDSGTGKSHTMKMVGAAYGKLMQVPVYYVQLSQDDTKTSIIMGLRIIEGTLKAVDGILSIAAQQGAIVLFDEITHSTHQLLLTLNSVDGRETMITIGDRAVQVKPTFRVMYGSNRSNYAGNIRVPQSFANRVIGIPFEYPSPEDEAIISMDTAKRKLENSLKLTVPESVFKYLAVFAQQNRSKQYPISSRNIAHAAVLMQLAKKINTGYDPYFNQSNAESVRRTISDRILGHPVTDTSVMQKPEINDFITFVSGIGVKKFRECVEIACGVYIDIDGSEIGGEKARQQIISSIL